MPPQLVAGGPRVLLRRLREIMAERQSAQTRLDKLVSVIAANMVAEVCSIYLRRAGGALELFAPEGLNREAVHRTRLTASRSEEHTSELQSRQYLVCRLLLEKKKKN